MKLAIGNINLILELGRNEFLMLVFLILLTAVSFRYMKKLRKDRVTKLGNFKTLQEVHNTHSLGSPIILGVKIIIVCMLFLTATESIQMEAKQPVTDVNYVVAIDSSQSMLMPDYEPDRISYAKSRLVNWIGDLQIKADMSVLEFSSSPNILSLPTKNPDDTIKSVKDAEVNLNKSGTDLSKAIDESLRLGDDNGKKRIIVVTDARGFQKEDIEDTKDLVRNNSAKIYFFELSRNEKTEQVYEQLNLSLAEANLDGSARSEESNNGLRVIADISGGNYYTVDDKDFFQAALDDTTTKKREIGINSSFYILLFLSFFVIFEMLLYSKYGAL